MKKVYLGDNVYVEQDDFGTIVLSCVENVIYLEDNTITNLLKYLEFTKKE